MGVLRKSLNWYARLSPSHGKALPPYEHVVQIGDPRLRKVSEPVPLDKIKTPEIQAVIKKLEYVIKKYGSHGMAAPQIGVNVRIFVMRITPQQISAVHKEMAQLRNVEPIPLHVFINPKMKVVDYKKVTESEGCESMQGYAADVARYKAVEVTGKTEKGEDITKVFQDLAARIAQHEMDHLDGKIYTDIMDKKTLECVCWHEVNMSKGKVVIPFSPQ